MAIENLSWADVTRGVDRIARRWRGNPAVDSVWGVPRGGLAPAVMLAGCLDLPVVAGGDRTAGTLVVDDVVDSGGTWRRLGEPVLFDVLVRKPHSPDQAAPHAYESAEWAVFPWEVEGGEAEGPEANVVRLLEFIGEDPTRDGLVDTPARMVRSWRELTAGYAQDPAEILGRTFAVDHDELVIVKDIPFASLCEHHVLPFTGTVTVGYLPGERIVGLSKVARLVECYARRLQVQERLTTQVAQAMAANLGARGVGVVIEATHACMAYRGVAKVAPMVTSAMLGVFRDNPAARAEFLALAGK